MLTIATCALPAPARCSVAPPSFLLPTRPADGYIFRCRRRLPYMKAAHGSTSPSHVPHLTTQREKLKVGTVGWVECVVISCNNAGLALHSQLGRLCTHCTPVHCSGTHRQQPPADLLVVFHQFRFRWAGRLPCPTPQPGTCTSSLFVGSQGSDPPPFVVYKAATCTHQVSLYGAFLDVAIDIAARGLLWVSCAPHPWGFLMMFLEMLVFVCSHAVRAALQQHMPVTRKNTCDKEEHLCHRRTHSLQARSGRTTCWLAHHGWSQR